MANETSTNNLKKHNDVASNATVAVASKMPFDFTLKLYDFVEKAEPVMGGGVRRYKAAVPRASAQTFLVQGNSWPQNKGPHQQIVAGFAITHGVPKEFWEEWLEQNADADYVKNGLLFAHQEVASTLAEAREKEDEKTNLERLDPAKLPKGLATSDDTRRAA